jgi:uncharacterized damage-inducible protein DinB
MAEDNFTVSTFHASWRGYQDHLKEALTTLTAEQLALRAAPGLRSIGENAMHIIGCRRDWFTYDLGEDGGAAMQRYETWNRAAPGTPVPTGAELAQGLDQTWQFMADCLARWSSADMQQTFTDDSESPPFEFSRAWVVWHLLEHDLHHGGEISLTLGMHGIKTAFAI